MSTTYKHVRMSVVDSNNNVTVLYPESTAADITVSRTNNSNIPSDVTQMQGLSDKLGSSAFKNTVNSIASGNTNPVESGAVYTTTQAIMNNFNKLGLSVVNGKVCQAFTE